MRGIYSFFGGRKVFQGWVGFVSIWVLFWIFYRYNFQPPPTFREVVAALLACLGITQFSVAWEDSHKSTVHEEGEKLGGVAPGRERPEPGER